MKLELGKCYEVLFLDGTVLKFRFIGGQSQGVKIETPIGSGNAEDLIVKLQNPWKAYWEVNC